MPKQYVITTNKSDISSFAKVLIFFIYVTTFSHLVVNLFALESELTGIFQYICEIILCTYVLFYQKDFPIIKGGLLLIIIALACGFFSLYTHWTYYGIGINGLFRYVLFYITLYSTACVGNQLSKKDIESILFHLIVIGTFIFSYAVVFQYQAIIDCILNFGRSGSIRIYLTSVYHNLNVFTSMSFFCMFGAVYFACIHKNKYCYFLTFCIYLLIVISNSRSAILCSTIMLLIVYFSFNKNKIRGIISTLLLILIIVLFYSQIADLFIGIFSHFGDAGEDLTETRGFMWQLAFNDLSEKHRWIFGNGIYSSYIFLRDYFRLFAGFHSTYVELLYWGGISLLLIYSMTLFMSCRLMKNKYYAFKIIWYSSFIGFCIDSAFEASSMLYAGNFLSIIAIILYVVIPRSMIDESEQNLCVTKVFKIVEKNNET